MPYPGRAAWVVPDAHDADVAVRGDTPETRFTCPDVYLAVVHDPGLGFGHLTSRPAFRGFLLRGTEIS